MSAVNYLRLLSIVGARGPSRPRWPLTVPRAIAGSTPGRLMIDRSVRGFPTHEPARVGLRAIVCEHA